MFVDYTSIAGILEEYFEKFEISRKLIQAKPRSRDVDLILIRKSIRRIFSLDPHFEIIGIVDLVKEGEMGEAEERAYREFKAMEFEAQPSPIFGKPKFRPTVILSYLSRRLGLQPSNALIREFESDEEFNRLFRKVRPIRLRVELESIPQHLDLEIVGEELSTVLREAVVDYYNKPERLRFYINSSFIISSPLVGRAFRNAFKLVLASGRILRSFVRAYGYGRE